MNQAAMEDQVNHAPATATAGIASRFERLPLTSYQKSIFLIIATAWLFDSMDLGMMTFLYLVSLQEGTLGQHCRSSPSIEPAGYRHYQICAGGCNAAGYLRADRLDQVSEPRRVRGARIPRLAT
jgi:hypothetical protein